MASGPASSAREWLDRLELHGIKLGLETTRALAAVLDHPEQASPVVHIAGTNGKGSVAAMVAHALTAAGYRTGRHTSPHLIHLEERFAIDGRPVDPQVLDRSLERVRSAVATLRERGVLSVDPTFFEVTTVAAFDVFRSAGVDVAVHEVGLGGRLDATNIVEPIVTAITSISRDHEAQLGAALATIASEKAGIAKRGVPLIVGPLLDEARSAVERTARAAGAILVDAPALEEARTEEGRLRVVIHGRRSRYGPVTLALRGRHQAVNAAVAVGVLEAMADTGFALPEGAIETGLEGVRWPGRLDLVGRGDRRVLVDGAHNPAGMSAFASYVEEMAPDGLPLVFGAMSDKRLDEMLAIAARIARPLILTRISSPRAASLEALSAAAASAAPGVETVAVEPPAAALEAAWRRAPLAAVAGSLYLAGDVLALVEGEREREGDRRVLPFGSSGPAAPGEHEPGSLPAGPRQNRQTR